MKRTQKRGLEFFFKFDLDVSELCRGGHALGVGGAEAALILALK
jgi:hypothetical protein